MIYTNPKDIESSYSENDIGKDLYDSVIKNKPKKIIEFGTLFGYSAVAMGMALHELGEGKLVVYDLFDKYKFKKSTKEQTQENIDRYGVSDFVELKEMDFEEWLKNPEQFDMMHLDISNKGDTIERLYEAVKDQIDNGSKVYFEGGSEERDNVEWMKKYNCKKIRDCSVPFELVNEKFPSLSVIKKI